MAKQKQARRLADNEAMAKLSSIKGSAQKARYVMDLIRGKTVESALSELTFCRKAAANEIKALLESAVANAENNHNLNVDDLIVKKAFADKSFTLKRFHARARGRGAKILKPRCHMTIVVAEQANEEGAA